MRAIEVGKTYGCGKATLEVGKTLFQLNDSTELQSDSHLLRKKLKEDGYLYIRNFYSKLEIEATMSEIFACLLKEGLAKERSNLGSIEAVGQSKSKLFQVAEYSKIPAFLKMIEGVKIRNLFSAIREKEIYTYPYKWLRAVAPRGHTGIHFDNVYMGRGGAELLTCWTALEEIPLQKGGLLVGDQFKNLDRLIDSYGKLDVDKLNLDHGWFSDDISEVTPYFSGQWMSSNFGAGDIVIFGMFQLHGSLNNTSNQYRISCDTRFQGVEEERDERWVALDKAGHTSNQSTKISELKKEWLNSFALN